MFFDDVQLIKKKSVSIREPPITPETGWRAPTEFPNLSGAVAIGFDTETKEPDFEHGPGWARGKGHIVGLGISAIGSRGERGQWYFPVRHEVEPQFNLDARNVFAWAKSTLETPHIDKVGANVLYDIGWLTEENIHVSGRLHDVQFAEALIDEQGRTALDFLAQKYCGRQKETNRLYEWCASAYGGSVNEQRANIYRASPRLVGPYGEADAALPLDIIAHQWSIILSEELSEVYAMEHDLIPLLISMRREGVSVDVEYAETLLKEFRAENKQNLDALMQLVGFAANPNSPKDLVRIFDQFGIPYPRTAATAGNPLGNPSFVKEFLEGVDHPIGKAIVEIRGIEKICGTFIQGYLLDSQVDGKIHCQFHPLRTSDASDQGAKTGRFSSDTPNLQNIPVRSEQGKRVRKAFIPDRGHTHWRKRDYSQIEYRMLAHFAVDKGDGSAELLRRTYRDDPKTDYHNGVFHAYCNLIGLDWRTMPKAEVSARRKPIKNVNFGLLYGESAKALAFKSGMTPAQGKEFFISYHKAAPYVKPTMEAITREVDGFGYVRTIAKRRTRFNLWESSQQHGTFAMQFDEAVRTYGYSIRRAFAYRGTNYKFQGSAADVIKRAMVQAYKDGIFDVIGVPKLQVHDELDFSAFDVESPRIIEAYRHLDYVLENSTPCNVPIIVSPAEGANWGEAD